MLRGPGLPDTGVDSREDPVSTTPPQQPDHNQPPPPPPPPYQPPTGGQHPPQQAPGGAPPYQAPHGHEAPPAGSPYAAPAPWQQAAGNQPGSNAGASFFQSLFDLSFSKYVTLGFAKVIYVLAMALIALSYLMFVFIGFTVDQPAVGVFALLLGWIPALVYLVLVRVSLEFAVAMIRTAQNTSVMANRT